MIHMTSDARTLFTQVVSASRVAVIPITDDGLVIIARGPGGEHLRCAFPTAVKAHPRVRPEVAARVLLTRDLRCEHTGLRMVAVLDYQPGFPRTAVFSAVVCWPAGRPAYAGCGRHRLQTITDRAQTSQVADLLTARVIQLLHGPNLVDAATSLPELRYHSPVWS